MNGIGGVERRLDDPPLLLDSVLAGEESRIAVERVVDEPLVWFGAFTECVFA